MIGPSSIGEVPLLLEQQRRGTLQLLSIGCGFPTSGTLRRRLATLLRGTGSGFVVGVLPGTGASVASAVACTTENRCADREGAFGDAELRLLTPRPQQANPRRPIQFALARTEPLARFTLEVEVKRSEPKGSLILVYAWQKDGYFNYVHLSDDAASQVEVHNGVFHCFGGDRVRISPLEGPGSLPTAGWHAVRMEYDAASGFVQAWVEGRTSPSLKAVDLSLGAGRIGLGSFFNTASFRRFRLARA